MSYLYLANFFLSRNKIKNNAAAISTIKQLEEISSKTEKSVKIFSYTDRISNLMDVSDFVITKPGGMTVSEALVKRLPILIMSPIPGQEERNARFLINAGVAAQLLHQEDMDSIFCQIIDNPIRVKHMKEMADHLAKPNASEEIVELIKSMVLKQTQNITAQDNRKHLMIKSI